MSREPPFVAHVSSKPSSDRRGDDVAARRAAPSGSDVGSVHKTRRHNNCPYKYVNGKKLTDGWFRGESLPPARRFSRGFAVRAERRRDLEHSRGGRVEVDEVLAPAARDDDGAR